MPSKENIGAIIFSRYDSSRLYGKALIDIEGRSLLGRVIDRAKLIKGVSKIIVATSNRKIDDAIYKFALSENITTFRGSSSDVFGRALDACKKYKFDIFARICGDRPFLDYELISEGIKIIKKRNLDLVTTMFPRTYPPGLTTEIIKKELLERFDKKVLSQFDREHLTTYFYKNPHDIKISNMENRNYQSIKNIRLVVDNQDDLIRAKWIAKNLATKRNIKDDNLVIKLALRYEKLD